MASNIKFKRSAVQNRVPTTAQLALGELALNTYDGKLYTEINTGSAAVVEIGSKLSSLVVDGDNGAGGGDVTFHGTTAGKDLIWDYSTNKLILNDNVYLQFGSTNNDSQFFHSGGDLHLFNNVGNTFVKSSSVYNIQAGHIRFRNLANNEDMANFYQNGRVDLHFDNQERLRTTTDGVDISGTGSLKIPVGTTAQRSASPVAGDLRYNTTTGGFEGYSTDWGELGAGGIGVGSDASNPRTGIIQNRIGVGFTDLNIVGAGISVTGYGTTVFVDFNEFKPGSFHRTIHNYTATASQTTFAGLNYENGEKQIAVYLNGARLSEATYTATSGTTVVLDVGASVGDEVEIINIHTNSDVDRKVNTYTATAGQTTFTGLSYNSKTELDVYLNGIRLASDDFTATSGSTVVLAVGASVNDTVDIVSTGDGVSFRSTTDASGDRFTLSNVGIGQDTTPNALNVTGNVNIVGVLTATTLHGDGSNLTNTGSTLSEPSSGTQRLVTTSLTTGTMTSSGTGSELTFDYSNNHLKFTDNTKAVFGTGTGDLEIYHTGSGSVINDIGVGHLHLRVSGSNRINITPTAAELCHNGTKKLETTSTGATVTGTLVADQVFVGDNETIRVGNSSDILLLHDADGSVHGTSGSSYIKCQGVHDNILNIFTASSTGKIHLKSNNLAETMLSANGNGSVELYYNGTKRFETTNIGANVIGNFVADLVDTIDPDSYTNHFITGNIADGSGWGAYGIAFGQGTGKMAAFGVSNSLYMAFGDGSNANSLSTFQRVTTSGAVELYHNGSKKFETTSTGASITGNLAVSGVLTYDDVTNVDSVGIITARSGINMPNNQYARFGNSQQFSVGHDNSNALLSYGTGTLFATGSTFRVVNNGVSENIIWAKADAEVELYYNNSMKFETTNTGVYVNGNIVVTGTVDGRDVATDGTKLDGIEASATADQTASEILTLIKTVDGTGSGLDADTLDGVEGASYLRSDANDTASGQITLTSSDQYPLIINSSHSGKIVLQGSSDPYIRFREGTTDKAYIQWHSSGKILIANTETNERLDIGSGSSGLEFLVDGSAKTVWHSGNDGSGSGLDADTLDGVQGSNYLRKDATETASNRITFSSGSLQLSGHWFNGVYSGTTNYIHLYPYGTSSGNASVTNIRAWNGSGGADTLQITGGTATGVKWRGYTVWTAENDGSGSTLDADTVDGLQASQFLRNDIDNTISAKLTTKLLAFSGVGSNSNNSVQSYAIYQAGGAWSSPFPDLIIGYHTGIKIGGYTSYGGTRFYSDAPERSGATEIFSVGNGDTNIRLPVDNQKLYFGADSDLEILHSGSTGVIDNNTGDLHIKTTGSGDDISLISNDDIQLQVQGSETAINCIGNGAVELYHNNSKKLETTSKGAYINDNFFGINTSNPTSNPDARNAFLALGDSDTGVAQNGDGQLELWANNQELMNLDTSNITSYKNIIPSANDTHDLGTTSARWRNIYTQDLQLSNEAKKDTGGNDVDGTWGDWTLQEGEEEVFMINNRTGKKYAMMLREVA